MKQYQKEKLWCKRGEIPTLPLALADEEYDIGIEVYEVSEVLYFNDKDIEDTPTFRTNL